MSSTVWWLEELHALAARFSACGVGPDLAGLTLVEAWGLFIFLRCVAGEG